MEAIISKELYSISTDSICAFEFPTNHIDTCDKPAQRKYGPVTRGTNPMSIFKKRNQTVVQKHSIVYPQNIALLGTVFSSPFTFFSQVLMLNKWHKFNDLNACHDVIAHSQGDFAAYIADTVSIKSYTSSQCSIYNIAKKNLWAGCRFQTNNYHLLSLCNVKQTCSVSLLGVMNANMDAFRTFTRIRSLLPLCDRICLALENSQIYSIFSGSPIGISLCNKCERTALLQHKQNFATSLICVVVPFHNGHHLSDLSCLISCDFRKRNILVKDKKCLHLIEKMGAVPFYWDKVIIYDRDISGLGKKLHIGSHSSKKVSNILSSSSRGIFKNQTITEIRNQISSLINDISANGVTGSTCASGLQVNSNNALKFVHALNRKFNLDLPGTFAYDFPSINIMSENIVSQLIKQDMQPGCIHSQNSGVVSRSAINNGILHPLQIKGVQSTIHKVCTQSLINDEKFGQHMTNYSSQHSDFLTPEVIFTTSIFKSNFDLKLFEFHEKEIAIIDPQQRILLILCHPILKKDQNGKRNESSKSVFVGISTS